MKCFCQHCNVELEFEEESLGQSVSCPSCDSPTTLFETPEPSENPETLASPLPAVPEPKDSAQAAPVVSTRYESFSQLLSAYVNQRIGLNWSEPKKYHGAKLVAVNAEYFSVLLSENNVIAHIPHRQILSVIEASGGVETGVIFTDNFPIVIEVMQLVVYSGAVGVGVSF